MSVLPLGGQEKQINAAKSRQYLNLTRLATIIHINHSLIQAKCIHKLFLKHLSHEAMFNCLYKQCCTFIIVRNNDKKTHHYEHTV